MVSALKVFLALLCFPFFFCYAKKWGWGGHGPLAPPVSLALSSILVVNNKKTPSLMFSKKFGKFFRKAVFQNISARLPLVWRKLSYILPPIYAASNVEKPVFRVLQNKAWINKNTFKLYVGEMGIRAAQNSHQKQSTPRRDISYMEHLHHFLYWIDPWQGRSEDPRKHLG